MDKSLKDTEVSEAADLTTQVTGLCLWQLCTTRNTTWQKKPRVFWWFGGRIIHPETDEFSVEAEQDSSTVCGVVGPLLYGRDGQTVSLLCLPAGRSFSTEV